MYEAINSVNFIAKLNKGILGPSAVPTSSSIALVAVPKPKQTRNLTSVKGLCYFCDESYSMEHIRVHKKLQIHIIEIDEEGDLIDSSLNDETGQFQGKEPQISVNALIKVNGFRTM